MRGGLESMSIINRFKLVLAAALFGLITLSLPVQVQAAVSNPAPAAKVSFTFDDGYTSAATQAAPTLAKYGLSGTEYVATGCVGMTTVPNTCQADNDKTYLTWAQIAQLKNTYGWEIGSHSATHQLLTGLKEPELEEEILESKKTLEKSLSTKVKYFAYPKGKYSKQVLNSVKKANYKLALSMDDELISKYSDKFKIPRVGVNGTHSLTEFRTLASPTVIKFRKFTKQMLGGIYEQAI